MFDLPAWSTLLIFKELSLQLKQEYPIPDYVTKIAVGTASYEEVIRTLWMQFKQNPTAANAKQFIDNLVEYSSDYWQDYMADVLNVNVDNLSAAQLDKLQDALDEHHNYLLKSLLPDLLKAIADGATGFDNLDYRVIFLYAGALWSFGFLATVLFDGLEPRDAGDLFIFLGPNDENTCTGKRGCARHVNRTYTASEIIFEQILPGRFRCLTSCRHILLPIVSM